MSIRHVSSAFARREKQIFENHHGSKPRHNDTPPLTLHSSHTTPRSGNEGTGEFVLNSSHVKATDITEQDPSDMKPAKKMWEKTRTPTPTSSYALANPGLSCFTPVRHRFPGPRRRQPLPSKPQVWPQATPGQHPIKTSSPSSLYQRHQDMPVLVKLARYRSSSSTCRHAGGSHFLVLQGHAPEEREGHCGCLGRVKGTIPQRGDFCPSALR
ncbi:hypothetical protein GGI42DRAFT_166264 [Trichoderma sp. SZMC 28013]